MRVLSTYGVQAVRLHQKTTVVPVPSRGSRRTETQPEHEQGHPRYGARCLRPGAGSWSRAEIGGYEEGSAGGSERQPAAKGAGVGQATEGLWSGGPRGWGQGRSGVGLGPEAVVGAPGLSLRLVG